jgi:hypothetical protein
MKTNPIIKYGIMALILAAGWVSCGKEQANAILSPEEPEAIDPPEKEPCALLAGVYLATHPNQGSARIDVFDTERMRLTESCEGTRPYSYEFTYKTGEQTIALSELNGAAPERELFFRPVNDSVFEMQSIHPTLDAPPAAIR